MKENIDDILVKKITSALSSHEQAMLNEWLLNKKNKEFFDDLCGAWEVTGKAHFKQATYNVENEWEALKTLHNSKQKIIHFNPAKAKTSFLYWVAASILVILVFALSRQFSNTNITIYADNSIKEVELPDNSIITLNTGSTLNYNKKFGKNNRNVILEGQAFFKVEKSDYEFNIHTNNIITTVVGTEFSLSTSTSNKVVLFVKEGKVLFNNHTKNPVEVSNMQKAVYNIKENTIEKVPQNNQNSLAWFTKELKFNDAYLSDIIKDLEEVYQVEIHTTEKNGHKKFTGHFNSATLNNVLEVICLSTNTKYIQQNNVVTIK